MSSHRLVRFGAGLLTLVLLGQLVIAPAVAQSGVAGSVVVAEGETVSSVDAVAGTIVIAGTVTGDVSGLAGNVVIDGTVEGDVEVATGNLQIAGTVGGDISAGSGSIHLQEGSSVGGSLDMAAGSITVDGDVGGDATLAAETIRLGDGASVGGSLTYDGALEGNTGAVAGDIVRDRTLGSDVVWEIPPIASWLFAVYAFLLNLVVGALLLALAPNFSSRVQQRIRGRPGRTGLVGLGVLLAVPVLLVVLTLSIVGIPLMLVGVFLFVLLLWIGLIYGRFALGMWLLSLADVKNRWAGLVLGLLAGAMLAAIPLVGWLVNLIIVLLGLGGLAVGLARNRDGAGTSPAARGGSYEPGSLPP